MINQIITYRSMLEHLEREFDKPNETGGFFLGEKGPDGITLLEAIFEDGETEHVDLRGLLGHYMPTRDQNPERYAIVGSHMHPPALGQEIRTSYPYWAVGSTSCGLDPGQIIGQFYITEKPGGDQYAMDYFAQFGVYHHLFIHPEFGSEGRTMTPELLQFTAYRYEQKSVGRVSEIPLRMIED
ncbi:MAG: hypothetical protein ABH879_04975 [archaeon]